MLRTACLSMVCAAAFAADVGIGVSVDSGGSGAALHVPIRTGTYLIEPMASFYYSRNAANDGQYTSLSSRLGCGVYLMRDVDEKIGLYLGVRPQFVTRNTEYDVKSSDSGDSRRGYYGFSIAPVLGGEYHIVRNFSVGGQVALVYDYLYSNDKSTHGVDKGYETSAYTESDIILRYYF